MNFPEFLRSIWTDPRYQALDLPTRTLLLGALCQVDIAGWWAPHPRLIAAELPGVDLPAATRDLSPWVQVHPTGWWSFKGYVALQTGDKGLNLKSGFHKGLNRVLLMHQRRETAAHGKPYTVEGVIESLGASPKGGSEPSDEADSGAHPEGTPRAPGDHGRPEPKDPCPKDPIQEFKSPTRGSGGDLAPSPSSADHYRYDNVLDVFTKMAPLSVQDVKPWVRDRLHKAGARLGWETVYKAAGAYFAGSPGARPTLEDFVDKLPRLVIAGCPHPSDRRTWWTAAAEAAFPEGVKFKRWRCDLCGHVEHREGSEFLPSDHVHSYVRQEGSGIVLGQGGEPVSVGAWERCVGPKGCGHSRAVRPEEVVA